MPGVTYPASSATTMSAPEAMLTRPLRQLAFVRAVYEPVGPPLTPPERQLDVPP